MVAVPQGRHSSVEHDNLQSLCTKLLSLLESQFVGGEDNESAQLLSFLDQMRTEIITSNNMNSQSISKQIIANSH